MMGMSEEEIGRFLLEMLCMGHSLGAHICGVVGGLAKHHQTHMMGTISEELNLQFFLYNFAQINLSVLQLALIQLVLSFLQLKLFRVV